MLVFSLYGVHVCSLYICKLFSSQISVIPALVRSDLPELFNMYNNNCSYLVREKPRFQYIEALAGIDTHVGLGTRLIGIGIKVYFY